MPMGTRYKMISKTAYKTLGPYIGRRFKDKNKFSLIELRDKVAPAFEENEVNFKNVYEYLCAINCGYGYKFLPHDMIIRRSKENIEKLWQERLDRLSITLSLSGLDQKDRIHTLLKKSYEPYRLIIGENLEEIIEEPKVDNLSVTRRFGGMFYKST